MRRFLIVTVGFIATLSSGGLLLARAADVPETVMATLRAKPGNESAVADALARHFETARQLNLLSPVAPGVPHVTLRGSDAPDRTYFVEIFTWRDAGIPDSATPAIQAIWREMHALVESRDGKPGLEFAELYVVAP